CQLIAPYSTGGRSGGFTLRSKASRSNVASLASSDSDLSAALTAQAALARDAAPFNSILSLWPSISISNACGAASAVRWRDLSVQSQVVPSTNSVTTKTVAGARCLRRIGKAISQETR